MKNYIIIVCGCLFLTACKKESLTPLSYPNKTNSSSQKGGIQYQFLPLDVPAAWGSGTSAFGNNNSGEIVGNFVTTTDGVDGFIYSNGQFTDVGVPGADIYNRGGVNDINDAGISVGAFNYPESVDPDRIIHTFKRFPDGNIIVLPDAAPGAKLTEATGINNSGTIVGIYHDASFNRHGFILRNGVYTIYDKPGAIRTLLTGINNQGAMVGFYRDVNNIIRGFRLFNGITADVVVPGATRTIPHGINSSGDIVGEYFDDADVDHGFLFRNGNYITLDFPGSFDTALLGINDYGQIVGTYDGYSRGLIAIPH